MWGESVEFLLQKRTRRQSEHRKGGSIYNTGNAFILKLTRYGNLLDMDEFGQYYYHRFGRSEVNRVEYDILGNILVSGYQGFEEFWDGYVYKVSFLRVYDGDFNLISEKFNPDSEYFRVNSGFGINEEQEIILPFRHNSFSRLVMFDYSVSPLTVVTSTGDMSTDIITNDISWNGEQLLIVGSYRNTVDFYNYGTGDSKSSSGGYDMYITIFNSFSGNFENSYTKTVTYGGSGDDEILRVKVDEKGYVYVLGYFTEEVDLNPYEDIDEYTSLTFPTYFVSRFDNELNYLGSISLPSDTTTQIEDFSIDFDGNLYFVGNFAGSVNFNTNENPDVISSGGDIDIFITQLATTEHYFPVPIIEDMDPDLDVSFNPQVNILSSANLGVINDTSKTINGLAIPYIYDIQNVEFSYDDSDDWIQCSLSSYTPDYSVNVDNDFKRNLPAVFTNPIWDIYVQKSGKIIIGGEFYNYGTSNIDHLVRLNEDGTIDSSFKTDPGASSNVWTISEDNEGRIYIGGEFDFYNGFNSRNIARLHYDGSFDPTFYVGSGFKGSVYKIAVQNDGKILVGGSFLNYRGVSQRSLVRLDEYGDMDTGFNGITSGLNGSVYDIIPLDDGDIIIVGNFTLYNEITVRRIARLNEDGSLDSAFNNGGSGASNIVRSVDLLPDGKYLISGNFISYNGLTARRIARLNSDGSLDESFIPTEGFDQYVRVIAIHSDKGILVGGEYSSFNSESNSHLVRLESPFPENKDFVCTVDFSQLSQGSHNILIRAIDNFNMITEIENYGKVEFLYDNYNPPPTIVSIGNVTTFNNIENIILDTYAKNTVIKGLISADVLIYFIDQSLRPYNVNYLPDGYFTVNVQNMLLGTNKYMYYSIDSLGNCSAIRTITINVKTISNVTDKINEDFEEPEVYEPPVEINDDTLKTLVFRNSEGPIVGAIIEIKGEKYYTDENGKITIYGLKNNEYFDIVITYNGETYNLHVLGAFNERGELCINVSDNNFINTTNNKSYWNCCIISGAIPLVLIIVILIKRKKKQTET